MTEQNRLEDDSQDAKYFTIIPRIVKYYSRSPFDLALWDTIREVAGVAGECYLSTEDLGVLSGMSSGKVVDCRNHWLSLGFLKGELRKDPGYPQPVWHLAIPNLWTKNLKWAEEHLSIKDRLAFKKSLHDMKPSPHEEGPPPGEEGVSPHEEGPPPGELKNNKKKNQEEEKKEKELKRTQAKLRVAETWKLLMRMDYIPWEGNASTKGAINKRRDWQGFLEWLTDKELEGYPVEQFCNWFIGDEFRANSISYWSPDGKPVDGSMSFKRDYMRAFSQNGNGHVPQETRAFSNSFAVDDSDDEETTICMWTDVIGEFKDAAGATRQKRSRFCGAEIPLGTKFCPAHQAAFERGEYVE